MSPALAHPRTRTWGQRTPIPPNPRMRRIASADQPRSLIEQSEPAAQARRLANWRLTMSATAGARGGVGGADYQRPGNGSSVCDGAGASPLTWALMAAAI